MSNEKEIFVIGHKNPDTDSICSALVAEILDKKNRCSYGKIAPPEGLYLYDVEY